MGLLDKILELFGKKSAPGPAVERGPKKALFKQVYEAPEVPEPEWAAAVPKAKLVEACVAHATCKYKLNVELKRIMSTRRGFDGNLETEYDGLAGGCGALKNFGLAVAKRDGYVQPYRYVDLNHIYTFCCDKPRRCPFYEMAEGSAQDLETRQRRI